MSNENAHQDHYSGARPKACFTPQNRVDLQPCPGLNGLHARVHHQQLYAKVAGNTLGLEKRGAGAWRERAILLGIWALVVLTAWVIGLRLLDSDMQAPLPAGELPKEGVLHDARQMAAAAAMMDSSSDPFDELPLPAKAEAHTPSVAAVPPAMVPSIAASDVALKIPPLLQAVGSQGRTEVDKSISFEASFGLEEGTATPDAGTRQAPMSHDISRRRAAPTCESALQAMQLCDVQPQ